MAYSTTYLYPEDLNGTNPLNLITDELQTLQAPGPKDYYFIIPKAAPFFADSLVVVNAANNQPYVEGDDYQVGHLFVEAMDSIGRPIAGSIRFMKPTIVGQVKLTYRTIGGPWGFSDQAILRELSNKSVNPLIRSWGDIDVLPYSFPPLPHDQRIDTLVGSKQINETLIKIAEILEATAEGTSKSHIEDKDNPHDVTKFQVGLGNVPNFLMATDQQHLDALRNDLFTNPRGVLLLVNKYAVTPLDDHIRATGNVHDMVPADIGLGNIPNWRPATPQQAIDPTNATTFMSPYTTSLLIQKLQNDPRLDQLIIDFNEHITANNPHHITPSMIGTYTASQIDQKLATISQGGDAVTFGGETPDEWTAKFPAVADINEILQQLFDVYIVAIQALNGLDVEDPVDPTETTKRENQKVVWGTGEYNAYALYNGFGDGRIIAGTGYKGSYPSAPLVEATAKWSTSSTGAYYVNPNGSVSTWGPSPIPLPTAYTPAGFQEAKAVSTLYASKEQVYLHQADDRMFMIPRTGPVVDLGIIEDLWTFYINNGTVDPRAMAVAEAGPRETPTVWTAYGDASWVSAFNTIKASITSGGSVLTDLRIGSDTLAIVTTKASVTQLLVYKINFGASITLTNVTSSTMVTDHSTGAQIAATAVTGITSVTGTYTHFILQKPIGEGSTLSDLLSFGDTSNGQLEIPSAYGPFRGFVAGNGFTVTINSFNFPELWGDVPDNSLLWPDGVYIIPE